MCAPSSDAGLETQRVAILVDEAVAERAETIQLEGLLRWIDSVLTAEFTHAGALAVCLQSDEGIQRINRRYRDRDAPTDVLSFPGDSLDPERYLGDIAISLEAAQRQAQEEGHTLEEEVRLLILHGILHCQGYDHETDAGEMVQAELALRERWMRKHFDA